MKPQMKQQDKQTDRDKIVQEVVAELIRLEEDLGVPKNVREKLSEAVSVLSSNGDISMNVSKALHMLDELSEDNNLQVYTRTQLWNVVSMLEKI